MFLHASTKYDNQVKSRFIRKIVVTQKTAIFHFLPVEDKTLLIWRDFLFVLNFLFYFLCGVWLEIQPQSDGLFRFVHHLEDLGVVVALRKHGYWPGLLQFFEVDSPGSQLNLFSIVPTAISWIFSQDVDSWPIALLLLLVIPSGPWSESIYKKKLHWLRLRLSITNIFKLSL